MSQLHALDLTEFHNRETDTARTAKTETSFYELIEALNQEVSEGEERLVVEAVKDLCESGRVSLPDGTAKIVLQ